MHRECAWVPDDLWGVWPQLIRGAWILWRLVQAKINWLTCVVVWMLLTVILHRYRLKTRHHKHYPVREVSTLVIVTISLIWFASIKAVAKGVRIIEVALYSSSCSWILLQLLSTHTLYDPVYATTVGSPYVYRNCMVCTVCLWLGLQTANRLYNAPRVW